MDVVSLSSLALARLVDRYHNGTREEFAAAVAHHTRIVTEEFLAAVPDFDQDLVQSRRRSLRFPD